MSERLGIVFMPVEVVDFIIRSADNTMRTAFGLNLGEPGISIIETFLPEWIQSGGLCELAA